MDDLSSKTVCVYDYGYNIALAKRLLREFGRVFYFRPWKDTEPESCKLCVGDGIEGLERVKNFFDPKIIDGTDLFVFPDIYDGDLQMHLVGMGKRVWGSRMAESVEYRRDIFLKTLKELGLETPPYQVVQGIDDLSKALSGLKDAWVKVNLRGDDETWHHDFWPATERKIEALRYKHGPLGKHIKFTITETVDTSQEVAYDGFLVTSKSGEPMYPKIGFLGYENKNLSHILTAIPYDEFPEAVSEVNEMMASTLANFFYRSAWGTEIKITEEGDSYFLDATCRQPSPPGEIILEMVQNLGEFMYHGANGDLIDFEVENKFGAQVVIYSEWSMSNWQTIQSPPELDRWVKWSRYFGEDDLVNITPCGKQNPSPSGLERVGSIVALGDSIEEVVEKAKEYAKQIKGMYLNIESESLMETLRRIKEGEDQGIEFPGTVPEPSIVMEE